MTKDSLAGYFFVGDLDRERPRTFHDYHSRVHHRILISVHLECLEYAIDIATRVQGIQVNSPLILTPGAEDAPVITTFGGHDPAQVEVIQKKWFEQTEVVETIREYQRTLQGAFDEFNLQYILGLMLQARIINLPLGTGEEVRLQERIRAAITNHPDKTYTPLDSAYYNVACRKAAGLNPLWHRLNDSEFGGFFILQPEEAREGVSRIMSPKNMRFLGAEPATTAQD